MVARAYPGGVGPQKVMSALEDLWKGTAAITRLDGELQAEVKRNEGLQRRGRDFRAQVGRRIEDLAREQSRLKREIAAASEDLARLRTEYERAGQELAKARTIISSIDKGRDEMTDDLRKAYEMAGAAAAKRQARAEAVAKVDTKIRKWQDECDRIDAQLKEYRSHLESQSSTIDEDVETGRERLTAKLQEREDFNERLTDTSNFLALHFQDRPECKSLLDELRDLDRVSEVASKMNSAVMLK
jgi:serine/threonine-protein kinase